MAKILILNGSPRKNGKTASLVKAFVEGAESAGNEVKTLFPQGMKIGGCLACESCQRNGGTCVQKDDMQTVNDAFLWADVIVFASPQYWGTITGQLKIVIDRLYATLFGHPVQKEFVVIMTARGDMYDMTVFIGFESRLRILPSSDGNRFVFHSFFPPQIPVCRGHIL